jgi:cytochrome c-type biogenesis protein CcmF
MPVEVSVHGRTGRIGDVNFGQILGWVTLLASLASGLLYLAAAGGRDSALRPARIAFGAQWLGLLGSTVLLWYVLFNHQFQYQYVASYSSRAMPGHFVYAAFWGGQEGTFLLWAFLTATLGLVLMRVKNPLTTPAMFFLNLPLVLLSLVTVMRGPFLEFAAGKIPADGNGLNPLLQDPWMTIHPPVLFTGFSSLAIPFAIAMAALVRRDWDGWIKPVLPWAVFSTAILATGFIMGGVWAYKVLGWGGYWGWDPVENGSLIPWLSNVALLHGLMIQRVQGSLRRTNLFLAITSYVLVLYASFLTRSGVLADFSVHSFVNLGLNGFLLTFLFLIMGLGYGTLLYRMREIPGPPQPLGNFSRESMMWLGQLVLMLMCALIAIGMSAPLITKLFGPPSNVQTSYYNLVNAPLAVALGLLLGLAPLMRWREQPGGQAAWRLPAAGIAGLIAAFATAVLRRGAFESGGVIAPIAVSLGVGAFVGVVVLLFATLPAARMGLVAAVVLTLAAIAGGVREPMPAAVVFAMAFALTANLAVTMRGFRAGWKHGAAYLGHTGFTVMMLGVVASSGYGRSVQVQLPRGEQRSALGFQLTFEGKKQDREGKDHVIVAVSGPERRFEALPAMYWSEFNQAYMKKPHIERFLTHDVYISPLEMVGDDPAANALWLSKGETQRIGQVAYTFVGFDVQGMGTADMKVAAQLRAEIGGRTVPVRPRIEMGSGGVPSRIPDYLPGGASVSIVSVDASTGRVALEVPGMQKPSEGGILAIEVSTKPLINLVWLGAILMLGSVFLSMGRRIIDLRRAPASA